MSNLKLLIFVLIVNSQVETMVVNCRGRRVALLKVCVEFTFSVFINWSETKSMGRCDGMIVIPGNGHFTRVGIAWQMTKHPCIMHFQADMSHTFSLLVPV